MNPTYSLIPNFSALILAISSSLFGNFKFLSSFQVFQPKFYAHFSCLLCTLRADTLHLLVFVHPNVFLWNVKFSTSSSSQILDPALTSWLGLNINISTLFKSTLNLSVKYPVLHPCKTAPNVRDCRIPPYWGLGLRSSRVLGGVE